jgi:hypothetical protein
MRVRALPLPPPSVAFVVGAGGARLRIDGEDHAEQVAQCVAKAWVGQFVADAPALGDGDDQAAAAQAGQMVGQALPRDREQVGQFRRLGQSRVLVGQFVTDYLVR